MKFLFICMLLLLCSPSVLMAQTLTFSVDDYCPYYCKDAQSEVPRLAAKPGFVIEILQQAFENKGYELEYVFRPWARGIREVSEGKVNGLIIAAKGDAPRHVFPKNEQGRSLGCYYVAADSQWAFDGVASLQGMKLGVVKGYEYSEPLNGFLKKDSNKKEVVTLTGDRPMERILNMIELGRLDVTMADSNIAVLDSPNGEKNQREKVQLWRGLFKFLCDLLPHSKGLQAACRDFVPCHGRVKGKRKVAGNTGTLWSVRLAIKNLGLFK